MAFVVTQGLEGISPTRKIIPRRVAAINRATTVIDRAEKNFRMMVLLEGNSWHGRVCSIPGSGNDRWGATDSQEKLPKLRVDMVIAAPNKKLGVLYDLYDCPAERQRLRRNPRAVAI